MTLELRRWLPVSLSPWEHDSVIVLGPVSGEELDGGAMVYWQGDQRVTERHPIVAQFVAAAQERRYRDTYPEDARWVLVEDDTAVEYPGLPTVDDILARIAEVHHLFSPNFSADAAYDYYLFLLPDADLQFIFLDDTNSGEKMLGFIGERADLERATRGAVGLLQRWFSTEWSIGVPEAIDFGLLSRSDVEAILLASPHFQQSSADMTDEDWEALVAGSSS